MPRAYHVGNSLHYQDLEWYEALEDMELKDKALQNKAIIEGLTSDDESSNDCWKRWKSHKIYYHDYDEGEYENETPKEGHELCGIKTREVPVCQIKRYKMIKYSFKDEEEYVAVKEDEYDDLTITSEEACRAYQEIFRMMDEGWMVTRTEHQYGVSAPYHTAYRLSGRYQSLLFMHFKKRPWKQIISTNIGGEFTNMEILKCWSLETSSLCGYCLDAACASGGSPAGIHGLFSGRYCGLAGRMVTLRVSTTRAKGVTTGTLVRLRRLINRYWEIVILMSFDPRLFAYVESPICILAFDSDWLSKRKFVIVCHEKVVRISLESDEYFEYMVTLHKSRENLMNTKVDLVPEATPVAKSPYRLAPLEMQELSEQLQEFKMKGYILPIIF
ncbi:hypothetical protein Tco_0586689 [Tanacetum coccineum]